MQTPILRETPKHSRSKSRERHRLKSVTQKPRHGVPKRATGSEELRVERERERERASGGGACSGFLVITRGNLDHLFSYAAGNSGDQKSDLALQACGPEGLEKAWREE